MKASNDILQLADERVLIAGDWHGVRSAGAEKAVKICAEENITTILQLGDFGLGRAGVDESGETFESFVSQIIEPLGISVFITVGNHDDHELVASLPQSQWQGVKIAAPNVYVFERGARFTISDARFGSLGGAYSIDRGHRQLGVNWWPDEVVTIDDVEALGNEPLDVLLAHDAPIRVSLYSPFNIPQISQLLSDDNRRLIQQAVNNTKPKLLFCGHWHATVVQTVSHDAVDEQSFTIVNILDREDRPGNFTILDFGEINEGD